MELHNYGRGVLHITQPRAKGLAYAFLRPQESSSNPNWIRKAPFTQEQFLGWYNQVRQEDGRWEYHKEYVGFSIPSSALVPFYQGKFNPLEPLEDALLCMLRNPTVSGKRNAFIIGTKDKDLATLDHELSRALSHVDPGYNSKTLRIIKAIPDDLRAKMDEWFINDGSFLRGIIPQEIVAEFADWRDSYMFKEAGLDRRNGALQKIHRQIRDVYETGLQTLDLSR